MGRHRQHDDRDAGLIDRADLEAWMTNNKTEWALRLIDSAESITFPDYINEGVDLLR